MAEGVATIVARLRAIEALLAAAPCASGHDESFEMLATIINEYEDLHSGVPYAAAVARITRDGRIYPPDRDEQKVSTVEGARRYRTRGHNVYIGENGAIAFENVKTRLIEFSKPGSDGKEVQK